MLSPRISERTVTPAPGKLKAAKITFPSAQEVLKPTADGIVAVWKGRRGPRTKRRKVRVRKEPSSLPNALLGSVLLRRTKRGKVRVAEGTTRRGALQSSRRSSVVPDGLGIAEAHAVVTF